MSILRKNGMTLYEAAEMLSELDDRQFYEVMDNFRRLSLLREKWNETLGEWLKNVVDECEAEELNV